MKSTGYQYLEISIQSPKDFGHDGKDIVIRYSQETGYFYASMILHGEFIAEKFSNSGVEICKIADDLLQVSSNKTSSVSEMGMEFLMKGESK